LEGDVALNTKQHELISGAIKGLQDIRRRISQLETDLAHLKQSEVPSDDVMSSTVTALVSPKSDEPTIQGLAGLVR
jgi:hypothetical protein